MKKLNILIVRTDFLGDCILSMVTLDLIKQSFDAEIDVIASQYNKDAFLYSPHIRQLYCIEHNPLDKKILNNTQLLSNIKSHYDMVLVLNRDLRNYHYLKMINFKHLYAHRLGKKSFQSNLFCILHGILPKYNFLNYDQGKHEVINQVDLVNFVHKKMDTGKTVTPPEQYQFYYTDTLPKVEKIKKSVVINMSGRVSSLKYLNDSLVYSLITHLIMGNYTIAIVVMESDVERLKNILNCFDTYPTVDIIMEKNIHSLASRIIKYDICISCDGGIVHIAAGLDMKVVAVFNSQNVQCWHPWTNKKQCIQAPSKNIYDVSYLSIIDAVNKLA